MLIDITKILPLDEIVEQLSGSITKDIDDEIKRLDELSFKEIIDDLPEDASELKKAIKNREKDQLKKLKEEAKKQKEQLLKSKKDAVDGIKKKSEEKLEEAKAKVETIEGSIKIAADSVAECIKAVPKIILCAVPPLTPTALPLVSSLKQNVSNVDQALTTANSSIFELLDLVSPFIEILPGGQAAKKVIDAVKTTISTAKKAFDPVNDMISKIPI